MMLVAALEKAKAGDKILPYRLRPAAADALWFEVTPEIENARDRKGIKRASC